MIMCICLAGLDRFGDVSARPATCGAGEKGRGVQQRVCELRSAYLSCGTATRRGACVRAWRPQKGACAPLPASRLCLRGFGWTWWPDAAAASKSSEKSVRASRVSCGAVLGGVRRCWRGVGGVDARGVEASSRRRGMEASSRRRGAEARDVESTRRGVPRGCYVARAHPWLRLPSSPATSSI